MTEPVTLDLIWGCDAIAAYLGITPGQAKYALVKGEIPGRKTLGKWVTSREALRLHFLNRERAA